MTPLEKLLTKLGIIKPKPRDWSKADTEVVDNFRALRKKGKESLQIQQLNTSSYNDRRFYSNTSPDYQGDMEFAGEGTNDRMPGTTPQQTVKPSHSKLKKLKEKPKRPNYI